MGELTLADFAPCVGEPFEIDADGAPFVLTLREASSLPPSPRPGGSFRLEFEGPLQPILQQSIYAFPVGDERHDIFIVPVGPKEGGMRYEAVFF